MQKNKGISPHVKDILGTVIYWRPRKEWGRIQVLIYGNFLFWRGEKKVKIVSCSVILTLCEPMDCIACQAPLSVGFSHQEYWSRLPCPSLGDLSDPGIEPGSPALQTDSLLSEAPGKPITLNTQPDALRLLKLIPQSLHFPRIKWTRALCVFLKKFPLWTATKFAYFYN